MLESHELFEYGLSPFRVFDGRFVIRGIMWGWVNEAEWYFGFEMASFGVGEHVMLRLGWQ